MTGRRLRSNRGQLTGDDVKKMDELLASRKMQQETTTSPTTPPRKRQFSGTKGDGVSHAKAKRKRTEFPSESDGESPPPSKQVRLRESNDDGQRPLMDRETSPSPSVNRGARGKPYNIANSTFPLFMCQSAALDLLKAVCHHQSINIKCEDELATLQIEPSDQEEKKYSRVSNWEQSPNLRYKGIPFHVPKQNEGKACTIFVVNTEERISEDNEDGLLTCAVNHHRIEDSLTLVVYYLLEKDRAPKPYKVSAVIFRRNSSKQRHDRRDSYQKIFDIDLGFADQLIKEIGKKGEKSSWVLRKRLA